MLSDLRQSCLILAICSTLSLVIVLSVAPITAAGYSVSPAPSQDTINISDREIQSDSGSVNISSATAITTQDTVTVVAEYDNGEAPNMQVINSQNPSATPPKGGIHYGVENGSSYAFHSSVFHPLGDSEATAGTYLISLWSGGEVVAAHPVVVQGYDISTSLPNTVEKGDIVTISVGLSEYSIPKKSDLGSVQLVISGENDNIEKSITQSYKSGEYSFDIDTNGLDAHSYDVYIAVRGDTETKNELLAVSNAPDITVTASGGSGGDDGTGGSGGDDGSGGSGGDDGSGGSGGDDGSNNPNETDETNETTASNITISNVSLEPDTVGNDQDEHTLSFDVSNVSTDGNADKFSISIPERVTIENVEDVRINNSEYDPNATPTNNTIEFSVNPSNATHPENLSIQLDLRLST